MRKHMNVFCESASASLYNIREVNSSFAVASLDIMYTGKNPNRSDIGREETENALPTLYNVPIVCNWDPDTREIGGHDVEFVRDDDGTVRMRNLTVPCGVVTDHTKFSFQIKEDSNGVEHEYLVADGVVLWKRQDVYSYIVNDLGGVVPHSMEITVTDGYDDQDSGYYKVKSFEFTALCLLGNVSPCFNGSKLEVYSDDSLKRKCEQMFAEIKQYYSDIASAQNAAVNIQHDKSMKGGSIMHEEVIKLAKEYSIDLDSLDFSLDDMSIDDIRMKFEEISTSSEDNKEPNNDDATVDQESDAGSDNDAQTETETFELNSNLRDIIGVAVESADVVHRDWGDMPKYFMRDFDEEKKEVYFESAEDWNLYGANYSMDGDNVVIDWSSKIRKKYAIIDFDEGTASYPSVSESVFSAMATVIASAKKNADEAISNYESLKSESDSLEEEVKTLRKYKADAEDAAMKQSFSEIFSKFSDLVGVDQFDALVSDVTSGEVKYDIEELEEKCFAIKGRVGMAAKFSETKNVTPKIVVDKNGDESAEKPYGGIVEKYLGED